MLIVGELLNASRKPIRKAIQAQDARALQKIARDQWEAGAHYLDVNAGGFVGREAELLKWLVATVQAEVQAPCCLDSPDPRALEAALTAHRGTALINSISLEKNRFDHILPLIAGTDLKVVALCRSDRGMPQTCGDRVAVADRLINALVQRHIPVENICVDPLVQPVSTDSRFGAEFLCALQEIRQRFAGVHTICGLSNISSGLPERRFLNQTFAVMAIARGLDSLIINPLDRRLRANLRAAEALIGRDAYCLEFIKACRANRLENL